MAPKKAPAKAAAVNSAAEPQSKRKVTFDKPAVTSTTITAAAAPSTKAKQVVAAPKAGKKVAPSKAAAGKKAAPAAGDKPTEALSAEQIANVASKALGASSKKQRARTAPYRVLQLRHLPPNFQEPELVKFYSQFGTKVTQCFVVRTRQSHRSRGTAYVRFADSTKEATYEAILDESHGMLLGNNTVTAKFIVMRKAMPDKKIVDARRKLDFLNKTKGKKLVQHDVTGAKAKKPWLTQLKQCAANERKTNAVLAKMGIKYEFHGFQEQLDGLAEGKAPSPSAGKKARPEVTTTAAAGRTSATPAVRSSTIAAVVASPQAPKGASPKAQPATPKAAVAVAATTPSTAGKKTPASKAPAAKTPAKSPAVVATSGTATPPPVVMDEDDVAVAATPAANAPKSPASAAKKTPATAPRAKSADLVTPVNAATKSPAQTPAAKSVAAKTPVPKTPATKAPAKTPAPKTPAAAKTPAKAPAKTPAAKKAAATPAAKAAKTPATAGKKK